MVFIMIVFYLIWVGNGDAILSWLVD